MFPTRVYGNQRIEGLQVPYRVVELDVRTVITEVVLVLLTKPRSGIGNQVHRIVEIFLLAGHSNARFSEQDASR